MKATTRMDPWERQAKETSKRRQRNAERAKRILNPKVRCIGQDTEFLRHQIALKEARLAKEREDDAKWLEQSLQFEGERTRIAIEQQRAKRSDAARLALYRQRQANLSRSVQSDIVVSATAVPSEDSHFLQFSGEDAGKSKRIKAQQAQVRSWLTEQQAIAAEKKQQEREEAKNYLQEMKDIQALQEQMLETASSNRALDRSQVAHHNKKQAMLKKEREQAARLREEEQNKKELEFHLSSEFMCEAALAQRDGFKGFDVSKRQAILDAQAHQQEEARAAKQAEKDRESAYEEQQAGYRRAMILAERERNRRNKASRLALATEQRRQFTEKRQTEKHLNKVVYTNPVDSSFFDQFGQSCR